MTRQITALVFLGPLALFAQPQPTPKSDAPTFSKADMERLIEDMKKVLIANTKSGTRILAKQFSEEMQKAAKAPLNERAAAMQKASDDYRKRVDAFNQGGEPGAGLGSAVGIIRNPMHPENGFYRNLLDACMTGNKFLTRTEDGMPVLQQVTVEGGTAVIHTFPPGLPIEKTATSHLSAGAVCPTLVRNALNPTPKTIAEAAIPSSIPKALQLCSAACATLEWRNGHFEVMARDGQPATIYTVESFTGSSIVMKRTELPHSGDYGLTATYKGTLEDGSDTAQGTVDFAWPGKPGYPRSATWRASWGENSAAARPTSQKKPEERGDAEQARLSAQRRQFRDNMAALLILGALFGAMDGGGESSSGSGQCTAGYWQNAGGPGQTWVCTAHGK